MSGWKVFFLMVGIILLVWLIGTVFGFLSLPFHAVSNVQETGHDIIDKTINADNVLYNYEWFKQQYEDYKSFSSKITTAATAVETFKQEAGPRSGWGFQDTAEYNRLNSVLLGLKQTRNDLVAEYNAKSKMVNRAIFKTHDLPETLPLD